MLKSITWLVRLLVLGGGAALGFLAWDRYFTNRTIQQLVAENGQLRTAIQNLTEETQIGYAKVVSQEVRDGKFMTRLLFVETDRSDPAKRVLEKEFEIEGDVAHFDALIVKFSGQAVMDGRERAMYLWRRVYGETTKPEEAARIETPGAEPTRYADLCAKLSLQDRKLFWDEIWALSNDPARLQQLGITAIYGNVVYRKLRPGLIYVFKISNTGQLYPETVPAL
jgi:hypothetical protein